MGTLGRKRATIAAVRAFRGEALRLSEVRRSNTPSVPWAAIEAEMHTAKSGLFQWSRITRTRTVSAGQDYR